jgi:hypothetical protein
MNLRRALLIAAVAFVGAAGPAAAQFQPPQPQSPFDAPRPQQSPFDAPPPQQSPFDAPQQQEPPCVQGFMTLRNDTEAKAQAVLAAQKRKVPLNEACKLLTAFAAAHEHMLKYAKKNATSCGIPPQILPQITLGHTKAVEVRTRVCKLAANPPRPAGPSLSDALGSGIPNANNIKTGRGTFDTLTGSPIGK